MATVVAQASGNFSAGATWVGGVKPASGDTAQTSNYTVTIDESFTGTLNPTGSGHFDVATGGITITGDLVMGSTYTGGGLQCNHASGNVTLNGVATGGAGNYAHGAFNNGAGTLNVTTATGGAGYNAHGAFNSGAGTLNVTTATGGAGYNAHGAFNNGAGTLNVTTATAGAGYNAYGAFNNSAGTLNVDLAVGNNWGVGGSGGYAYGVYGSGAAGQTTRVKRTQSGPYGAPAIGGAVLIEADVSNSAQFRTAYGGATLTLTDPSASADWPAEADVRAGVEFDNGDKTGTAHIPAAANVALGIPVDATTGTAVLTAAAVTAGVWDAARSGHATDGTFGDTAEWAGSVDEAAIAAAAAAAILAAADIDPISANVTHHAGVAVAAADLNGNVPVDVKLWKGVTINDLVDGNVVVKLADVAHGGSAATLNLKKLSLINPTDNDPALYLEAKHTPVVQSYAPLTVLGRYGWEISDGMAVALYPALVTEETLRSNLRIVTGALSDPVGMTATVDQDLYGTDAYVGWMLFLEYLDRGLNRWAAKVVSHTATTITLDDTIPGAGTFWLLPATGLSAQQTRDAMKLAPTAGDPAAGSVDAHLDTIVSDVIAVKAITDTLDRSALTVVTVNDVGAITIKRTLTLAAVVSGLTIPADWTACFWTVKRSVDDTDADALVQILVSNPGDQDDGVQVLMGTALDDESDGSLAVNQALGTVTIALGDASTALLEDAVELVWDIKVHTATGKTQPGAGTATITTAVTRA